MKGCTSVRTIGHTLKPARLLDQWEMGDAQSDIFKKQAGIGALDDQSVHVHLPRWQFPRSLSGFAVNNCK